MSKESNSGISVFQRYLTVWDNQSCSTCDYCGSVDRGSCHADVGENRKQYGEITDNNHQSLYFPNRLIIRLELFQI